MLLRANTVPGRRELARIEAMLDGKVVTAIVTPDTDPASRVLWLMWRCRQAGVRLWLSDDGRVMATPTPPADMLPELRELRPLLRLAIQAGADNAELGIDDPDVLAGTRRWLCSMESPEYAERWREAALAVWRQP